MPQKISNQQRLMAAQKYVDAAHGALYPTISIGAAVGTNFSTTKNNVNRFIVPGEVDTIGIVSGTTTPVVIPKQGANLFADPYWTQFDNNINTRVGMSLSVPIFNGLSAKTAWRKQKLNYRNLELQQDLDNMTLKQDIYKAYTDAMTALQKFKNSSKAIEAAQKEYDFSQKRYDVGLLNTIDLIISQNNLFRARIDRLSAQYDYVFKMKVLEFYKGQGIKL
jgi:outer membrane protein